MNVWQHLVEAFHRSTGSTIGDTPALRDRELRAKLIMEEAVETVAAMGFHAHAEIWESPIYSDEDERGCIAEFDKFHRSPNLEETIDGLCDLLYVTLGTAIAAGVDLHPHFRAVHEANMKKLRGPKRADGKQLKPEGWTPPDHHAILKGATRGSIG